jgi:hypothetical protein
MSEESSADRNVEIWKIKKLIKSLELARGQVALNIPYQKSEKSHQFPHKDCKPMDSWASLERPAKIPVSQNHKNSFNLLTSREKRKKKKEKISCCKFCDLNSLFFHTFSVLKKLNMQF